MQGQIQNDLHQVQSLNLLNDMVKVESIDYSVDAENVLGKLDKLQALYKSGKMDFNLVRYIPGLANVATQGQIDSFNTNRKYADENYKDKNTLEFNIQLSANRYAIFNSMHICLPIKLKSKAHNAKHNANDVAAGLIPVNNFFAHWFKEINMKRHGDNIPILPLRNTVDVYGYSYPIL